MNTNFFEYKFRSHSKEEARKRLKRLKLGKPIIQNVTDTYLISHDDKTEKIYESDGKIFFITVIRKSEGFEMNQEEIDAEDKKILIDRSGIDTVMKKARSVWKAKNAEVALDEVKGLKGVFIELQGSDKDYLSKLLSELEIKESDLITIPYNQLHY